MIEKLTIHDFAGISNVEMTLDEINILIGPQATGKSICAKSFYLFKNFVNDIFSAGEQGLSKIDFERSFLRKFNDYFPIESLGQSEFILRYEIEDKFIQVFRTKTKTKVQYSDFYIHELTYLRKQFKGINNNPDGEDIERYKSSYKIRTDYMKRLQTVGSRIVYSQLFIPAGRSFFAILQSNIFSFLSANKGLDPFLAEFGSLYENLKRYSIDYMETDKKLRGQKKIIEPLVEEILGGKYTRERGKDYLALKDGRRTSLVNSSSGQQEILPIAIILSTLPFLGFQDGATIYIEEPEAHLFPSAQRKIVELIATIYNRSNKQLQFIITTHSPYVLAAFNNLLHAGNISLELDRKHKVKLQEIVAEEQWLKSNQVNVYSLLGGTAECIKSKDTGLITTNILDSVSDELGSQFDSLLNVE